MKSLHKPINSSHYYHCNGITLLCRVGRHHWNRFNCPDSRGMGKFIVRSFVYNWDYEKCPDYRGGPDYRGVLIIEVVLNIEVS